MTALAFAACGKKGPPLEPLRFSPNQPADLAGRRLGPDVQLRFTLPTQNATGTGPIDLERIEIYAVTVAPGAIVPPNRELMTGKFLVKTIPVRPLPEEGDEKTSDAKKPAAVAAAAKDDRPLPGEQVTVVERLTAAELTPALLPKPLPKPAAGTAPPVPVPADPPVPSRIYVARGFSRQGNPGAPSVRATVPLVEPPPPPTDLTITVSETALTLQWTPPPAQVDPVAAARAAQAATAAAAAAATVVYPAPPPPAKQPAAGAEQKLVTTIDTAPLNVKQLPGFALPIAAPQPLTYNVYAHADGRTSETPLNASPLAAATLQRTDVQWDKEQCFVVRSVRVYANVAIEGEALGPTCVTPHDTFAPAAPAGLRGVAATGLMNLSWTPNTEADLAGYLVLRGEAPGDKLQALTPEPIRETNYRDTTVKPGVRYVYVVVAVDKATPPNMSPQSARYEEVAR